MYIYINVYTYVNVCVFKAWLQCSCSKVWCFWDHAYVYICIYIYVCTHMYTYTYFRRVCNAVEVKCGATALGRVISACSAVCLCLCAYARICLYVYIDIYMYVCTHACTMTV